MSTNRRGKNAQLKCYGVWADMLQRCKNPNIQSYKYCGARGIKVCERWKTFVNFYADMGEKPKDRTLDRIDNDGDYCKDNCRWATSKEQAFNKRKTKWIEYNGKKLTAYDWALLTGISSINISHRLQMGWSIEEALTIKILAKGQHR